MAGHETPPPPHGGLVARPDGVTMDFSVDKIPLAHGPTRDHTHNDWRHQIIINNVNKYGNF